ncbi:DUF4167 domain-containing protein [uncultured Devosia sp.]|uniref:DUF4167 domain-containing protein n=1 Tax=uncultured Devosia sp. TaxID=211434 RepID=UPI0035CB8613
MRPNSQNNSNKNRSRGRNGGRKHVNPLSRSFESNGPDVKVRGNAPHIAEKYMQLARDAQSSGDSVMAENYLQHAEHYFRIVSAAQPNASREEGEDFDDDMPEINSRFSSPQPANSQQNDGDDGEQPYQQPQQQPQNNGQERQDRGDRQERQPRPDRPSAEERAKAQQLAREQAAAAAAEAAAAQAAAPVAEAVPAEAPDGEAEGEPRKVRERRPRRRRPAGGDAGVDADGEQPDVGALPAFLTGGTTAAE